MVPKEKLKPTDLKLLAERPTALEVGNSLEALYELSKRYPTQRFFAVIDPTTTSPVGLVHASSGEAPVPVSGDSEAKKGGFGLFKKKALPEAPAQDRAESRSVGEVMITDPLVIELGTASDVFFEAVFARKGRRVEESVIVVREGGGYFGVIQANAIFRQLYGFLGGSMKELRVQKEKISLQHSQVVQVKRDLELTNIKLSQSRDKALAGVRMKNIFLANMSHEIRTPLNGVFGMLDLLYDTEMDKDQEQLVSTARSSAETLMRIINDILDFSKIEAGKVSVESMPFNLYEVVESSVALYAETANEKEILLSLRFEDAPTWVVGDPHRYQQVINNLISNAIKFTEEGQVEICISGVSMGSGEGILTEIKDSGIGIPQDKLNELFLPFTQVDPSHVRKYGGTGLGLSICMNLVELMDGELECESAPGKGSLFYFTLPFSHYQEQGEDAIEKIQKEMHFRAATMSPRKDFSGMRVLLVEDNIVNQEVAERFLLKLNCEVVSAENGQMALSFLADQEFHCIFMDCQMPVMDGFEATRDIRTGFVSPEHMDIFIAAMTAHAMSGDRERCLNCGMDHYFSKPFGLHDFRKSLVLAAQKMKDTKGVEV